jgi:hypothetical protein
MVDENATVSLLGYVLLWEHNWSLYFVKFMPYRKMLHTEILDINANCIKYVSNVKNEMKCGTTYSLVCNALCLGVSVWHKPITVAAPSKTLNAFAQTLES